MGKKLKLDRLKVQSFITTVKRPDQVLGGATDTLCCYPTWDVNYTCYDHETPCANYTYGEATCAPSCRFCYPTDTC